MTRERKWFHALMAAAIALSSACSEESPAGSIEELRATEKKLSTAAPSLRSLALNNGHLAINVGADGHFNVGVPVGMGWSISFVWPDDPWSSYTTFTVDGSPVEYGSSSGSFTNPPANDGGTNLSRWTT